MKNKGFTLIELMIVVAIIAIIAAIAIPNLLRSRLASNESATIGNLKAIVGAQTTFNASTPRPGYPVKSYANSFADLRADTPPFLDKNFDGPVQGYGYLMAGFETVTLAGGVSTVNYDVTATPTSAGMTGERIFWVDSASIIRLTDADGDVID